MGIYILVYLLIYALTTLHVDKKHTYIYPGAGAGAGFVICCLLFGFGTVKLDSASGAVRCGA